ncbi:MAG: hypothetical protein J6Y94_06200, partial [Bacteriovoracaceae bacterium]|nr:hypothetical protein [Bacteriovoracaceae bacterium]
TKAEALKCKKVIPEVEVKEQEVYTCQVDIHCPIGPRMNIPPESVPFEPSKLQFTDFSKVGLTFSQNDSEKVFDSKTNEGQQAVGDDSKSVSSAAQANTTSFTTEIQTACIACKAQIVAVESGCTEHHKNAFAHAVACTPRKEFSEKAVSFINDGIKLAPSAKINPNFFERALELALPQAKAMDSQGFMLGMGAIGIGILVGVIVKQQWAIDKLIAYPGRRIALFGGAALLAGVTVFTTSNIVSKAKKNIEKIDKILKQFAESAAAAEAAGDVNPRKPRNVASLFVADVNLPGNQRFPCVVNGSNSTTCGSYAQVLAEALSEDEKDVEREGISLDPSVLTFGKQLGGGIDGLQGNNTLSGAAINNLAAGANQQAAITKESENVRNKLNDYLKENGEEPIDFKAQDQKVADQLKQNTLDGLKESGTDIAAVFQDPGLEVASKLASDEVDHNPWSSFDFDTGSRKASRGLASANIRDLPALSLETDAQKKAKLQLNLPENSYISDKQGPSIWRVISKRYLQNFDRFFERITEGTTPVPMATAPVKEKKVKGKTKGKK